MDGFTRGLSLTALNSRGNCQDTFLSENNTRVVGNTVEKEDEDGIKKLGEKKQ